MAIDRKTLLGNVNAGQAFLQSRRGNLLHIIGNHAGATASGFAAGHLVLDHDGPRAGFVPVAAHRSEIIADNERHAFGLVGGLLTEMYFLGGTDVQRGFRELKAAVALLPQPTFRYNADNVKDLTSIVHNRFYDVVVAMGGEITANFNRAEEAVLRGTYLLRGFHVIPTAVLTPYAATSEEERTRERALTESENVREQALREFLRGA
jgi:hypothetical protein